MASACTSVTTINAAGNVERTAATGCAGRGSAGEHLAILPAKSAGVPRVSARLDTFQGSRSQNSGPRSGPEREESLRLQGFSEWS
jgi:hypothetical protein